MVKTNRSGYTKRQKECLLAITNLQEDNFPARLVDVARAMNIKSPTTLSIIRTLEQRNLVKKKEGMIILTERGNKEVKNIMRCHRIIETLFYKNGMPIDVACKEAAKIDKQVPELLVKELFKYLGYPKTCPHGLVI